jgi:hypothetical protein
MATSRKRRYSVLVIQESLLLRGRCYPTHPITIGPFRSRSDPKGVEKGRRALCRRTLLATAGAGLVPLRLSALSRLTYCYLRTGYLGHSTLVSRYRTEGGSHSTIGMVLLYVGLFLAPRRGALVSSVGSKAQCLGFNSWGLLDKSEVADPVRGWIQLNVMPRALMSYRQPARYGGDPASTPSNFRSGGFRSYADDLHRRQRDCS